MIGVEILVLRFLFANCSSGTVEHSSFRNCVVPGFHILPVNSRFELVYTFRHHPLSEKKRGKLEESNVSADEQEPERAGW
jgi:hypothetical protein